MTADVLLPKEVSRPQWSTPIEKIAKIPPICCHLASNSPHCAFRYLGVLDRARFRAVFAGVAWGASWARDTAVAAL